MRMQLHLCIVNVYADCRHVKVKMVQFTIEQHVRFIVKTFYQTGSRQKTHDEFRFPNQIQNHLRKCEKVFPTRNNSKPKQGKLCQPEHWKISGKHRGSETIIGRTSDGN